MAVYTWMESTPGAYSYGAGTLEPTLSLTPKQGH